MGCQTHTTMYKYEYSPKTKQTKQWKDPNAVKMILKLHSLTLNSNRTMVRGI